MGLSDDVNLAIRAAPESRLDPSIALTAAQMGGDVVGNAQSTSHMLNSTARASALDEVSERHGGKSLFGATLGWVGGGIKGAMDVVGGGIMSAGEILNKPLEQVKQEYRFLRDVESRHGFIAMLGASVPMAAAGTLGAFAGGPQGAALAAEGMGWLQEALARHTGIGWQDSWLAAEKGEEYRDPHGGQAVSPGRDAARFLNALTKHVGVHVEQHEGFDLYDAVSGLGDGLFSVVADPLMQAGSLRKGLKGAVATEQGLVGGGRGFLGPIMTQKFGAPALVKGSDIAVATAGNKGVQRALGRLAEMDAGEITARYRKLRPFAKELGEAKTMEEVGQVLMDKADAAQMMLRELPRAGVGTARFGDAVRAAHTGIQDAALTPTPEDAGRVKSVVAGAKRGAAERYKRATTFIPSSFDAISNKISNTTFYLNDEGSIGTIYDMAKWGHNDSMARSIAEQWAKADGAERRLIYRNLQVDNIANRMEAVSPGWRLTPEGEEVTARIGNEVDKYFGGIDAGRTTPWGYDKNGRPISKMTVNGRTVSEPLLEGQRVNVPMPDYMSFDRNLKALRGAQVSTFLADADDLLYRQFTERVFKRWALVSGGFAIRAVAQDLVPYLMKAPERMAGTQVAKYMAKHGFEMVPGEEEGVRSVIARFAAHRLAVTPEHIEDLAKRAQRVQFDITDNQVEDLTYLVGKHGSNASTPAVLAGYTGHVELIGAEDYAKDGFLSLKRSVPKANRVTDETSAVSGEHRSAWVFWHGQAKEIVDNSPASVAAAKELRDALHPRPFGLSEEEFTQQLDELEQRVFAAEKTSDPKTWTPAERAAYDAGDWKEFSRLRGYTDDEIAEYEKYLGMMTPHEGFEYRFGEPGIADKAHIYQGHLQKQTPASIEEATHRAVLAAKRTLDTTPEEILAQNQRHYHATNPEGRQNIPQGPTDAFGQPVVGPQPMTTEQVLPQQGTGELKWVPGKKGQPGHYEQVGEEEVGLWTTQKPLVNPGGNIPGGLREPGTQYGFGEGATDAFGRPVETPPTATYKQMELVGHEPSIPSRLDIEPAQIELDPTAPFAADPHLDWAAAQVEMLKGTLYGADGTLHKEILDAIADGRVPDPDIFAKIPVESRPAKLIGEPEKPLAPKRLNGVLFNRINQFINWAARDPIFQTHYLEEMDSLRHLIGEGLTYDEVAQRALTRATKRMLPHVDNRAERSLMSEHARNWIPFYGAQQQAYSRMWRLLEENPAAARRIQLAYTSMADFGGIYDDEAHNQHFVLPGTGFITTGVMKGLGAMGVPVIGSIPQMFSGNLKSLTSVSPFLEEGEIFKPGPLVAMSARLLNNVLPETKAVTDPLVGEIGASQPFWEMLVPNATMRNVLKATVVTDNRTSAKAVLDAVQYLEYKQNLAMKEWLEDGNDPADPGAPSYVPGPAATDMERSQFIDRVKNHARILMLAKAAFGSVSPVAPAAQVGEFQLKTELYDAIKEKGIADAISEFLVKHPDATPYTVFQTDAGTPSPIESTHPAQQWVTSNMSFIKDKRYSAAASYFVPQSDDPFSQEVYQEQMAMGLRRLKAPDQLIKDIEISQGNRWYFDTYKPAKDAALKQARSPRERRLINQTFSQKGDMKNNIMSLETMKMQNPVWYTNFSSGGRDTQRQLAVIQMQNAIADGAAPESPMTEKINVLLNSYQRHAAAMLPGRTDSFASAQRKRETENWTNYLKKQVETDPDLTMVVNAVFRGL